MFDGTPIATTIATRITTLPRNAAAGLITGYQRYLSPYKGFSCAHRVLHRGESCSQYIKRTILERGLSDAWPIARERLQDCRQAYEILRSRGNGCQIGGHHSAVEGGDEDPRACGRSRRNCNEPCRVGDCACEGLSGIADCGSCAGDISSLDCGSADCSAIDCSGLDCGGADCSGCDIGSCG
ncbi:membrane protein insertion efficiency factor YidD [Alkalinema sp. FACHB-956]|uniref:membrane protein insertion efficiency factor YidD n=1 Tax=Alkalinema sp. FACHB-956 TaxID=2692768 RepID=UPI001683BB24|nr:membrane protein insertion efficiency factor YidD [Alkalinema sp. FACHB-956]MBD2328253.1 membrane protein insertion efficiency factor YidD [Alkalinema sp. FACHB-956]